MENFGSSSGSSTSREDLEKKVASMESDLKDVANVKLQMQALVDYICAKEGGKIPDELAGLFTSSTQQVRDVGFDNSSNNIKRSYDGSNANLKDFPSSPSGM